MLFDHFYDVIEYWAQLTPDAPATWFSGNFQTYADIERQMNEWSQALIRRGLRKGDVVAVLTTPRPEFLIALSAVHKAGGVYVGINPNYTQREQLHVVSDSRPKFVFSLAEFDGREFATDVAYLQDQVDSIKYTFRLDDGPTVGCLLSNRSFLESSGELEFFPAIERLDPSTIVYTSGSTGAPKGAVLPHFGISYGAYCTARELSVPTPRVLCNLPANHTGCIVDVQGATLTAGGMVAYSEKFDPSEMLRLTEELKLTNLQHVPTVLQLLAMHPDFATRDLSSLKIVGWGGAALPIEFVRTYSDMGLRLFTIYGMTETCANATYSSPSDSLEELAFTVGRPNPDADVVIMNDEGKEVSVGEQGEVWYRHEGQFLYYLNKPDATAQALTSDGFLRTGDIGVRLPSGHIQLVGRKSEMFKSGGLNVYPREVELVLEDHDSVAIAAVVGIPDDMYGEVGAAFVVCEPGQNISSGELKAWCKENLAGYKVPKVFEVRTELPLLPIGKVDKQALRSEFSK